MHVIKAHAADDPIEKPGQSQGDAKLGRAKAIGQSQGDAGTPQGSIVAKMGPPN